MLNFKRINIIFATLLLALILWDIRFFVSITYYVLLIIAYSLFLFYGSYFVQSQFYMKTICKANTKLKKLSLTFDDGPLNQYTPQVLAILAQHNIKATFFCIGKNMAKNPSLLKDIYEQGHVVGSHSYSHSFWFDLFSAKKMEADLRQSHHIFETVLGVNIKWFRPPYGVTNPNLNKAVKKMGYTAIGWNVRSMDTVAKSEQHLLQKLKKAIKPGAIFLFHDSTAITVNILSTFIQHAQDCGYEIAPLEKLLNLKPYVD